MFLHYRNIKEEVDFYERQNKRLAVDDLLCTLFGKKPKHNLKIRENEKRIERLWFCITDIIAL